MTKKGNLRVLNAKVKPMYNEDERITNTELEEGFIGKGPLVRKYIDNLDMEFIAFHARERRDQETAAITVKLPAALVEDISTMVQSGKLAFKDRSQLIRSATMILVNYYGLKFRQMSKRMKLENGIQLCGFEAHQKRQVATYVEKFEKIIPEVIEHKSDEEIDRFLREHLKILDGLWDKRIKENLVERFSAILKNNGIDPIPYFGDEKIEEGEEV